MLGLLKLIGLDSITNFVTKQIDKVIPDKNKKAELEHNEKLAQVDFNKTIVTNTNPFIAFAAVLPKYLVILIVVYMIAASIWGLPVPDELKNALLVFGSM